MVEQVSAERIQECKEAFSLFDTTGDGSIITDEVGIVLRGLGRTPTEAELAEMIKEADTECTGFIDFPQFLMMMDRNLQLPTEDQDIIEAFEIFDPERNGYLSTELLRNTMVHLGEGLDTAMVDQMMREADPSGTGQVDYRKFVQLMCQSV